MDDIKTRQQVIEKIQKSTSILVTVSKDPSVDALAAALALTLTLDKLEKHATAVFSGIIPPAISFLQPEKTFENTTDSLRDFIIALDKSKADHLRYKVEGDVVKIFITPYKTTITNDDLEFSQGDFNVELVIALGVDNQEHLDGALDAHGKILHDASVVTITSGEQTSKLGTVDWHDGKASGLSEMIADLGESLKTDKPLIDQQIATALLTGIVAQTDRFSNPRTTSKVMTTAAQLMSAGADQQLVAAKLEESHEIDTSNDVTSTDETSLKENEKTKIEKDILSVPHETLEEMEKRVSGNDEDESAKKLKNDTPKDPTAHVIGEVHTSSDAPLVSEEPSMGGTLSATTGQAADDARHEKDNDQNKIILSHAYLDDSSDTHQAMSGATISEQDEIIDPLSQQNQAKPSSTYAFNPDEEPAAEPDMSVQQPQPQTPTPPAMPPQEPSKPPTPSSVGLPMPPPVPDFSTPQAPPLVPQPTVDPTRATTPVEPPERLGDILAPESEPNLGSSVPPVSMGIPNPTQSTTDVPLTPPVEPTLPAQEPPSGASDPGQFKIPGQQ